MAQIFTVVWGNPFAGLQKVEVDRPDSFLGVVKYVKEKSKLAKIRIFLVDLRKALF